MRLPAANRRRTRQARGPRVAGLPAAGGMLGDKLRAFQCFRSARRLALTALEEGRIAEAVHRAFALDPWARLWALEGVGWAAAGAGIAPRDLPADLPVATLLPLHTGWGLARAVAALEELPRLGARSTVERFVAAVEAGCTAARAGAALEAFGLAVRTLRPLQLATLGAAFAAGDRGIDAYFWHGVGRALCFVPSLLPRGGDAALRAARAAAPAGVPRVNVVAGFCWATALVGIRRPGVLERLLAGAEPSVEDDGLPQGVAGAVVLWVLVNGCEATLQRFLDHPAADRPRWRQRVVEPCRQALATVLPGARAGSFGELFHALPAVPAVAPGPSGADTWAWTLALDGAIGRLLR